MKLRELENIKHGSPDFPVVLYRVDKDFPRYRMICHWHVEYELIRVVKGVLHLRLDEVDHELSEGEAILIRGGTLHSGEPIDCVYDCAVFSINPLLQIVGCREQLAPIIGGAGNISRVYGRDCPEIMEAVDDIFSSILDMEKGYKLALYGGLYRLFSIIIREGLYIDSSKESVSVESRYVNRFKNVLTWLEEHYGESITLETLAEIAGFSPKYFCRVFSKLTGRSPIDYLNCYRIERASEMLITGEKQIIDIAAECGFYDLSYFVKVFRRYKGIPPGQYRKMVGTVS